MEALLNTGAAFGAALGVSILPFRKRRGPETWLMGSLLILGAMAVASITLQHQQSSFDRGGAGLFAQMKRRFLGRHAVDDCAFCGLLLEIVRHPRVAN